MKTTAAPTTRSTTLPAAAATAAHPLAAIAPPTAPDRAPEQNAADARRFAELLRARRSEAAAPPTPAAPPCVPPATDAVPKPDAAEACDAAEPAGPHAPKSPRAPSVAKPSAPTTEHATATPSVAPSEHEDGDAAHDELGSPALAAAVLPGDRPPALALLGAQPAALDVATARDDTTDLRTRAKDDGAVAVDAAPTVDGQGTGRNAALGAHAKAVEAADERVFAAAAGHAQPNGTHADATFASALGDVVRTAESATPRTARLADAGVAPIAAGSVAAAPADVRDAAAPAPPVALATPIDSPDFAAALGVQVSVLARDGVQHAELHLHPVETGPVSIRIEVDGTNARIDFGADFAATRHAIEQGLPELASALRDAGLTLAGGGVSQHAGSRPRGDDDSAAAAHAQTPLAAASSVAAPARAAQRRIAAGGVDLYA